MLIKKIVLNKLSEYCVEKYYYNKAEGVNVKQTINELVSGLYR